MHRYARADEAVAHGQAHHPTGHAVHMWRKKNTNGRVCFVKAERSAGWAIDSLGITIYPRPLWGKLNMPNG